MYRAKIETDLRVAEDPLKYATNDYAHARKLINDIRSKASAEDRYAFVPSAEVTWFTEAQALFNRQTYWGSLFTELSYSNTYQLIEMAVGERSSHDLLPRVFLDDLNQRLLPARTLLPDCSDDVFNAQVIAVFEYDRALEIRGDVSQLILYLPKKAARAGDWDQLEAGIGWEEVMPLLMS
ncbi:MAG: hypothetical protein AAGC81_13195 [Pseudomonadota bacterium]